MKKIGLSLLMCGIALAGRAQDTCTGAVTAGTVTPALRYACPTTITALTSTGYTAGGGMVYQWQESTDSTSWTNIWTATDASYTFEGITTNTYYRLYDRCIGSGIADTSNVVRILLTPCFCTPSYESSPASTLAFDGINMVGSSATVLNDTFSSPIDGYTDRTSLASLSMLTGGTYAGTVTYNKGAYYYQNLIWIDFNDDGSFQNSETVTSVFGMPADSLSSSVFSLSIPADAVTGAHRMRVRNVYSSALDTPLAYVDPCEATYKGTTYYYGCAADYEVNIAKTTGVAQLSNTVNEVSLYPNPTTGMLNLSWNAPRTEQAYLMITNVLGEKVFERETLLGPGTGQSAIDLSSLISGMYTVGIHSADVDVTRKIVIQK